MGFNVSNGVFLVNLMLAQNMMNKGQMPNGLTPQQQQQASILLCLCVCILTIVFVY